jgi:5,5'-dehydrodivanillate O-demethylase
MSNEDLGRTNAELGRFVGPYEDYAHTGPGTLAGDLLRSFWQPVFVSAKLDSGRAKPIKILGQEYTLYRGETGTVHLVDPRCAHRGTLLSTGSVEGDCIRCFYHGWAYDETGQCVDQAIERPSFAAKVKIRSYPTFEYLGQVFAYLGEGEPPEKPRFPEFEGDVVLQASSTLNPFNFFQNLENNCDALHLSWVHRMSNFFADNWDDEFTSSGEQSQSLQGMTTGCTAEETEYGIRYEDIFDTGEHKVTHFQLPNILHVKIEPVSTDTGWRDLVSFIVPVDDTSYRSFGWTVAYVTGELAETYRNHPLNQSILTDEKKAEILKIGDEILAGNLRLTVEDIGDLARNIWLQDYIAQRGQGVIADRVNERLGRSDRAVMFMRELWSREMEKIATGREIKHWRWPGHLSATTGARL